MTCCACRRRELMSSNRTLHESVTRESSANRQLRLENEELHWKLRQRDQMSASLPVPTLGESRRPVPVPWSCTCTLYPQV